MRAIARRVDIAVSSLYRHFDDHAALMDELRADAYQHLADRLQDSQTSLDPSDYAERFMAIADAFRDWAHACPEEFTLLYTPPIETELPYATTVIAARGRARATVGRIIAGAVKSGQLTTRQADVRLRPGAEPWEGPDGPLPAEVVATSMSGWSALVGFLCMEERRRTDLIDEQNNYYRVYVRNVMTMIGFADQESPSR